MLSKLRYKTRNPLLQKGVRGAKKLGLKYSNMILYRREPTEGEVSFDSSYTFETYSVDSDTIPTEIKSEDLTEQDEIVTVRTGEEIMGFLWVSERNTYRISPIERTVGIEGKYIWKVFVFPEHRGKGVATQLLCYTVQKESPEESFSAFVAANNIPSRRLFEFVDFAPVTSEKLIKVGSLQVRP